MLTPTTTKTAGAALQATTTPPISDAEGGTAADPVVSLATYDAEQVAEAERTEAEALLAWHLNCAMEQARRIWPDKRTALAFTIQHLQGQRECQLGRSRHQ